MKSVTNATAGVLLLCVLALTALAQQSATATLTGIVSDPQGAVIAGAQVSVTQLSTGVRRETTTNSDGVFALTNLSPGEYEVKIQATGFAAKVSKSPVAMQVGQSEAFLVRS